MIYIKIEMDCNDDYYSDVANIIVSKWDMYLLQEGHIHGELAFADELQWLIAQELRIRGGFNAIDKTTGGSENSSEEASSK